VDPPAPVATGRRGGSRVGARDGHGGARCRAVSGRGGMHRGGAGERRGGTCERCGGNDGRYSGASRTLEEEEEGLLQSEISSIFPSCPWFRGVSALSCLFSFAG
jgi:hypothetical protein